MALIRWLLILFLLFMALASGWRTLNQVFGPLIWIVVLVALVVGVLVFLVVGRKV